MRVYTELSITRNDDGLVDTPWVGLLIRVSTSPQSVSSNPFFHQVKFLHPLIILFYWGPPEFTRRGGSCFKGRGHAFFTGNHRAACVFLLLFLKKSQGAALLNRSRGFALGTRKSMHEQKKRKKEKEKKSRFLSNRFLYGKLGGEEWIFTRIPREALVNFFFFYKIFKEVCIFDRRSLC